MKDPKSLPTLHLNVPNFYCDSEKDSKIKFVALSPKAGHVFLLVPEDGHTFEDTEIASVCYTARNVSKWNYQSSHEDITITEVHIKPETLIDQVYGLINGDSNTITVLEAKESQNIALFCKCQTPQYGPALENMGLTVMCSNADCKEQYHLQCLKNG